LAASISRTTNTVSATDTHAVPNSNGEVVIQPFRPSTGQVKGTGASECFSISSYRI
jgi:hypothetical protein